MKIGQIGRLGVIILMLALLIGIFWPSVGSLPQPIGYQTGLTLQLRELHNYWAIYARGGSRPKTLGSIGRLKDMKGFDPTLLEVENPITGKTTKMRYFEPFDGSRPGKKSDFVIFMYEDPLPRFRRQPYTDKDLKELQYIGVTMGAQFVFLDERPPFLDQIEETIN